MYRSPHLEVLTAKKAIKLHNFDLIKEDSTITVYVFGSNNKKIMIDPSKKEEIYNRLVVTLDKDTIIDEVIYDIVTKHNDEPEIDFIESDGKYYQV